MENIKQIKVNEELHDIEDAQARKDILDLTQKTNQLKEDIGDSRKAIKELADKKITKFYANSLGETTLNDSDNGKIQDMILYGKSVQDGIPTPDAPVEIQSVVNPSIKMIGKNLAYLDQTYNTSHDMFNYSSDNNESVVGSPKNVSAGYNFIATFIAHIEKGKTYYLSGNCTNIGPLYLYSDKLFGNLITISGINKTINLDYTGMIIIGFYCKLDVGEIKINNFQLELGSVSTEYEPFKFYQSATIPYTLNAIPFSSGGNVTIDGQQYIADYVDIDNKKLVKMVDESKLDTTVSIIDNTDLLLETPTITDLSDEEVQAFKELTTYYTITNVFVTSEQLDGYTTFNYPVSLKNGWNYIKEQLGDTREYIYDMELLSAEAYVNSEYAVTLTELGV